MSTSRGTNKKSHRDKIRRPDPLFISEDVPTKKNNGIGQKKPSNLTMQMLASPYNSPLNAVSKPGFGDSNEVSALQRSLEVENSKRMLFQIIADHEEYRNNAPENSCNWLLYQTLKLLIGETSSSGSSPTDSTSSTSKARQSPSSSLFSPRVQKGNNPSIPSIHEDVRTELLMQCSERLNANAQQQSVMELELYGVDDDGEVMDDFPAMGTSENLLTAGMRSFVVRRRSDQLAFLRFRITPASAGVATYASPVDKAIEYINHLNEQLREQGTGAGMGHSFGEDDDEFYSLSPSTSADTYSRRQGSSRSGLLDGDVERHTISASPFAGTSWGQVESQDQENGQGRTRYRSHSSDAVDVGTGPEVLAPGVHVGDVSSVRKSAGTAPPTTAAARTAVSSAHTGTMTIPTVPAFQFCICRNNYFLHDERNVWHFVTVDAEGDRRWLAMAQSKYVASIPPDTGSCSCSGSDSDSDLSVCTTDSERTRALSASTTSTAHSSPTKGSSAVVSASCGNTITAVSTTTAVVTPPNPGSTMTAGIAGDSTPECGDGTWQDIASPSTSAKMSARNTAEVDWKEFKTGKPPPAPLSPTPPEPAGMSIFTSMRSFFS